MSLLQISFSLLISLFHRCATEQRLEMDRRLDLAIKKMEKEGVQVFKARKFIEEEILTMHCPRCKMAFADWDGCNGACMSWE